MRAYSPRATSSAFMKNLFLTIVATLALAALPAKAATYTDSTGDGGGSTFLDITSVDVNNTATVLSFKINVTGDPSNAGNNWGTFLIGIDAVAGGGNINGTGGWGKDIQMSVGGMDYFVGCWLNNGAPPAGDELHNWTGSAWGLVTAVWNANPFNISAALDTSSVTISFDIAAIGLSAGNSFNFDVYSSANDNTAVDALDNPAAQNFNNNPYDTGAAVNSYTIQAVPEPATWTLLGLGALIFIRRVIRRSA